MKKFNNQKILLFALVILTLINLGFVISVFVIRQDIDESRDLPRRGYQRHFMITEIGFDEEQMTRFQEFRHEYRETTVPIHRKIRKLNHELVMVSTAAKPDTAYCGELSRQIGDLHAELKMLTSMHLMKVRSIARPEQLEKLSEMYLGIFNADDQGNGPGNGMGRQHRHGRNRLNGTNE